jgi:Arc/MetJ-type ribon-helix-helix transcriptional regulator
MTAKTRLSATVDTDVLESVRAAVAVGEAESVSAYVNDALRLKAEHDRRLRGIDDFIAAYEAELGEITEEDRGRLPAGEGVCERILTSDPADLRGLARAGGVHVGLISV